MHPRLRLLSVLLFSLLACCCAQFTVSTVRLFVQCTAGQTPEVIKTFYADFGDASLLVSDIGSMAAATCANEWKFQFINGEGRIIYNNSDPAALVMRDGAFIWDNSMPCQDCPGADVAASAAAAEVPVDRAHSGEHWTRKPHARLTEALGHRQWGASAGAIPAVYHQASLLQHRLSAPFSPHDGCSYTRTAPCSLLISLCCNYNSPNIAVIQPVPVALTPSLLVGDVLPILADRCGAKWTELYLVLTSDDFVTLNNSALAVDALRSGDLIAY